MDAREMQKLLFGTVFGLVLGIMIYQSTRVGGGVEKLPAEAVTTASTGTDGGYFVNCSTCSCDYSPAASPYQDPAACAANITTECGGTCGGSSAGPDPCATNSCSPECACNCADPYDSCVCETGSPAMCGSSAGPPPPTSSASNSAGSASSPC